MLDCILHYKYSYGITAALFFNVQDTVSKYVWQAKGRLVHFLPEIQIP